MAVPTNRISKIAEKLTDYDLHKRVKFQARPLFGRTSETGGAVVVHVSHCEDLDRVEWFVQFSAESGPDALRLRMTKLARRWWKRFLFANE